MAKLVLRDRERQVNTKSGNVNTIAYGPFKILYGQYSPSTPWAGMWWWMIEIGQLFYGKGDTGDSAPTKALAIAAAEAALLEEISKVVTIEEER